MNAREQAAFAPLRFFARTVREAPAQDGPGGFQAQESLLDVGNGEAQEITQSRGCDWADVSYPSSDGSEKRIFSRNDMRFDFRKRRIHTRLGKQRRKCGSLFCRDPVDPVAHKRSRRAVGLAQ